VSWLWKASEGAEAIIQSPCSNGCFRPMLLKKTVPVYWTYKFLLPKVEWNTRQNRVRLPLLSVKAGIFLVEYPIFLETERPNLPAG